VADLCSSPGSGVYAAPASMYQIWHVDQGTGLHDSSIALPCMPECIAVTPDGQYFYAAATGHGVLVVDGSGEVQASNDSYGVPVDMAVSGDGQRAVICCPGLMKAFMLSR